MKPRSLLIGIPLVCAGLLVNCSKTPPANVAASVNGRPITFEELDKQYEILFGPERENISADERAA
ncbi:MAG: hypothetical protein GY953_46420, partial [bacterium]|nr:hypothetical protein [bacterium]